MIEILIILLATSSFVCVGLVFFVFKLLKQNKDFDKNNPEFLKLQNDLDKEKFKVDSKDNYIAELKKDKQQLIDNKSDVDTFKEISNRSFHEYKSVVSDYKNFHEKLTGDVKYQGKFNESKLRKILEKHGLKEEDGDFTVEKETIISDPKTGQEKKIKPDFVLNLEENKKIVIDCKVSLKNFEDFVNSKDKDEREKNLKKHIDSVRKHIADLGSKNYSKLYGAESLQYVIMFMPFEATYLCVLEKDQDDLLDLCFRHKVLLAGPISVMSLIATVTAFKNQKKNNALVSKIVKESIAIYDKYTVLKKSLVNAISSHKAHTNSLKEVINVAYQSPQSLESKLVKLKNTGGLGQTKDLKTTQEDENNLEYIQDHENKQKIINIKNDKY